MRIPTLTLAWGLWAAATQAQFLVNELSFGHDGRIAPERSQKISNFQLLGDPALPEILSNKLILTPAAPAPGGRRGAVWSEKPLELPQWVIDVDLRVSGPERGGGNVNIWLVKDGAATVGTSSVYTAGRFEGLALVLDATGPAGGTLRGYLNDGSKDYRALTGIESLAFGRCDYAYRNLGRPSQIKIRQTDRTFQVDIDDSPCFGSEHVALPQGYRLGISAASADVPDSAEIFKVVVLTVQTEEQGEQGQQQEQQKQEQQQQQQQPMGDAAAAPPATSGQEASAFDKDDADADAGGYISSETQFADLHNRLQRVNHHLSTISRQVGRVDKGAELRHTEMAGHLDEVKTVLVGLAGKVDRLASMEDRMDRMQREMKDLHNELRKSLSTTERSLISKMAGNLAGHHDKITEELRHPGFRNIILVIVGGQIFLVVAFYLYKRKRANSPKKYL